MDEGVDITPDDLVELFQRNPLAKAQVEAIALRRELREAQEQIASLQSQKAESTPETSQ